MSNKHPNRAECFALLKKHCTPEHVIRHCRKVSDTAVNIAKALNQNGHHLDIELIEATCLIHDIARVEDKHWEVGAQIAADAGYDQEAEIISLHMFYNSDPTIEHLSEIDIVCLSDRMVKEDEYVGLETRMQYILEKFKGNSEATERISNRVKENKILIKKIEDVIGTTIDSLMKN